MYLFEGVVAILGATVLYGWAYGLTHGPHAPGWARSQLFASVVSLVLVCIVPIGAGLVALGLSEPFGPVSWAGLGLLALAPVLLWLRMRQLR